jgi:hypothetical protein
MYVTLLVIRGVMGRNVCSLVIRDVMGEMDFTSLVIRSVMGRNGFYFISDKGHYGEKWMLLH